MEQPSGFFGIPDYGDGFSALAPEFVYASETGFCGIWKGTRDGKARIFKALKPEYRGDPICESQLRKEYEIGLSLSHPNICEYYAFVSLPSLGNCIEMEWVDGKTLEALLHEGIPVPQQGKILTEICQALDYIHHKQVLHRDLKPENIMVTHNGGNVKILDFGLSDTDSHMVGKAAAGTRNYAAPEVLGGGHADVRSDIYSLGRIMLEMDAGYRRIAAKCCADAPEDRYRQASEVLAALRRKRIAPIWLSVLLLVISVVGFLLFSSYKKNDRRQEIDRTFQSVTEEIGRQAGITVHGGL